MIKTGVTRKIDELGRIVLPKELRKNMNINSGDDFQIYIDDNKIVLEKYNRITKKDDYLITTINNISMIFEGNIYLVVDNKIINCDNSIISKEIHKIICERKNYNNNVISNIEISNRINILGRISISPIIIDSDLVCSVIIVSNKDMLEILLISKLIRCIIVNYLNIQ